MRTPNSLPYPGDRSNLAPITQKHSARKKANKPFYREIKKPDLISLDANLDHITAAAYNDESMRQSRIDCDSLEKSTIDLRETPKRQKIKIS